MHGRGDVVQAAEVQLDTVMFRTICMLYSPERSEQLPSYTLDLALEVYRKHMRFQEIVDGIAQKLSGVDPFHLSQSARGEMHHGDSAKLCAKS